MVSSVPGRFGLALAWRAVLFSALLTLSILFFTRSGYPLVAFAVGVGAVLALASLLRFAQGADHAMAQAIDGIATGTGRPLERLHPELASAVDRALSTLAVERVNAQRGTQLLQALCDAVPVPLFSLDAQSRWQAVNRAAWQIVGDAGPGAIGAVFGEEALVQLQVLVPGRHAVVQLARSGARLLASCNRWSAAGDTRTLIALVPVDHMLDRVETQAWQDLVRVLSHEMMNSLTPIMSISESLPAMMEQALREGSSGVAEITDALETIHRRSIGLIRFVEKYRTMSDMPVVSAERVRIDELLARVLPLVDRRSDARLPELTHLIEPPDLVVQADASLLEQAIINLILNARDAVRDAEQPRISIRCALLDDVVEITVSDNGAGIPPDVLKKIFVPFFTTKTGGSGIGLSFVRQVALAHGGSIECTSNALSGTRMTLRLPQAGPALPERLS
jgi:signal transduction histidine kinase